MVMAEDCASGARWFGGIVVDGNWCSCEEKECAVLLLTECTMNIAKSLRRLVPSAHGKEPRRLTKH